MPDYPDNFPKHLSDGDANIEEALRRVQLHNGDGDHLVDFNVTSTEVKMTFRESAD